MASQSSNRQTWIILGVLAGVLIVALSLVLLLALTAGGDSYGQQQLSQKETEYLAYVRDASTGHDAPKGAAVTGSDETLLAAGNDACRLYREVDTSRYNAALYMQDIYDVTFDQGDRIARAATYYLCGDLITTP